MNGNSQALQQVQPSVQKRRDIRDFLQSPAVQNQMAMVLPKHITPDRMVRVGLTAVMKTPKLLECSQESLLNAMMTLSAVGLEPDGRHAHLIPYETKYGGLVAQAMIDYKGYVVLGRRNGVKGIHTDVVCENDVFDVSFEGGLKLVHRIDYRKPRGPAYAAYCYFILDGEPDCEVMQRDEIEAIRRRSRAGNSGPWVTDWNEMAKKSTIRRAQKKWPLDAAVQDAMGVEIDEPEVIPSGPTFSAPAEPAQAALEVGQQAQQVEPPKTRNMSAEGRAAIADAQRRRREKERKAGKEDQIPGAEAYQKSANNTQPQDDSGPGNPPAEPYGSESEGTARPVTPPAAPVEAGGQISTAEPPGPQAPGWEKDMMTDGQRLLSDVWDIILRQNPSADFDDLRLYGTLASGIRKIDWDTIGSIVEIPDDVARALAQQPKNMTRVVQTAIGRRSPKQQVNP